MTGLKFSFWFEIYAHCIFHILSIKRDEYFHAWVLRFVLTCGN